MTVEEIYFVSRTISSVAVVASLIYLALQTRQTALNQRALMHQARVDTTAQELAWLGEPSMMPVYLKHIASTDTPNADTERFLLFLHQTYIHCEEIFHQWREGMVDVRRWKATERNIRFSMSYPGVRAAWKLHRNLFEPDFAAAVDACMAQAANEQAPSAGSVWKQLADQELAALTPRPATA